MKLSIASYKAIKYACLNFHYAKRVPVPRVGYNVFNELNEWCGVILYSSGSNQHLGKKYGLVQGEVCELVRMALNGKQSSTSKALAISLKLLKKECPLLKLVVSYADTEQGHVGTIYQATNWMYEGEREKGKQGTPSFVIKGKSMHGRSVYSRKWKQNIEWLRENVDPGAYLVYPKGKHKYLYPFNNNIRKLITIEPYPKNISG